MNKIIVSLVLTFGLSGIAFAGGDASKGKEKAAACVACHGEGGNSMVTTFPKLAGQHEKYLLKQMQDIQCGELSIDQQRAKKCAGRSIPTMTGQVSRMSDADLSDIAAYFATQTSSVAQAKPENLAKGEEIYRAGIRAKDVAACTACHSPTGNGNAPAGFPALSGQHADYLAAQLRAFRAAADGLPGRSNDGDIMIMRDIAYRMSDSEIDAVANYISGLR
ncbi:MAG: cytochrome c553 [Gammaproteobacteria bacterium]|jgi:cytochrome c553